MKISDIIKSDKLTLSFEVFPPKTDAAYESVAGAIDKIADLKPSFMSVTYGAGGGTSEYTVSIAENIQKNKTLFLLLIFHVFLPAKKLSIISLQN